MMYNLLPQNVVINIPNPAGGVQAFNSAPANVCQWYRVPYGAPNSSTGEGRGRNLPTGAAHALNLHSCAFVIYIYAPAGVVQHVAVYHASGGDIPNGEVPTDGKYCPPGVAAADIHVVFASSLPDRPHDPNRGIQTSANGLFAILNAGVPQANIRVLTETGMTFGASSTGDVGQSPEHFWSAADLANVFTQTVATATARYNAQFPPGVNSIGPWGSTHNKTEAAGRLQQLTVALNAARTDNRRIQAMTNFFNSPHSYKAGSLNLLVTQELIAVVQALPKVQALAAAQALPAVPGGITTVNAQQCWTLLFQQIQAGWAA